MVLFEVPPFFCTPVLLRSFIHAALFPKGTGSHLFLYS